VNAAKGAAARLLKLDKGAIAGGAEIFKPQEELAWIAWAEEYWRWRRGHVLKEPPRRDRNIWAKRRVSRPRLWTRLALSIQTLHRGRILLTAREGVEKQEDGAYAPAPEELGCYCHGIKDIILWVLGASA